MKAYIVGFGYPIVLCRECLKKETNRLTKFNMADQITEVPDSQIPKDIHIPFCGYCGIEIKENNC